MVGPNLVTRGGTGVDRFVVKLTSCWLSVAGGAACAGTAAASDPSTAARPVRSQQWIRRRVTTRTRLTTGQSFSHY